jgi:hypothetical protein
MIRANWFKRVLQAKARGETVFLDHEIQKVPTGWGGGRNQLKVSAPLSLINELLNDTTFSQIHFARQVPLRTKLRILLLL